MAIARKGRINKKVLGKAQAREFFSPLIESLAQSGGLVEITDYGKVAAVLMSYKDYLKLLAINKEPFKPAQLLCGSMTLVKDLEKASQKISLAIEESIAKSASEI